jgi:hypothetical protein
MQLFNESLILEDCFNIPRLMNMSFYPNRVENDNNKLKTSSLIENGLHVKTTKNNIN